MARVYDTLSYFDESYKKGMQAIKKSEQLTPKEYGMHIQSKKKKKNKRR